MEALFPREKRKAGRRRNVSIRAWIGRRAKGGVFYSYVSLGDGVEHRKSTCTKDRDTALVFNRLHAIGMLTPAPPPVRSADAAPSPVELPFDSKS